MTKTSTIGELWGKAGFAPNSAQKEAILHSEGPLYITAGPGSGKTRVLLWRTLNLLVYHDVAPDEIYLSTFTEKAAHQLHEGLQALLGAVTELTGRPFDLAQMYVGTVHSLCQRLLADRRFSAGRQRRQAPRLLDELGQYFYLYRTRNWRVLLETVGLDIDHEGSKVVHGVFGGDYDSKHEAVTNCIALFNRLSEECVAPEYALAVLDKGDDDVQAYLAKHQLDADGMRTLLRLYASYRQFLATRDAVPFTDFSLIQQEAYDAIRDLPEASHVFRHVIVDEYQDTNTIQERLFFRLAAGTRNLCVVGDDDQALYRFRGATVENFVEFPRRCRLYLGCEPRRIALSVNYRSRPPIVHYYGHFMNCCHWERADGIGHYRVVDKSISAHRKDPGAAVVKTSQGKWDVCFPEIADLVCGLIDERIVEDANQIAFLFPSLKSVHVGRMKDALEQRGLKVYAPRAGKFLEVDEARDLFGVLAVLFDTRLGRYNPARRSDWSSYRNWLHAAKEHAKELIAQDDHLAGYVMDRQTEIETVRGDYALLMGVVQRHGWDMAAAYDLDKMKRPLAEAVGLSERARRNLVGERFERAVLAQKEAGHPFRLNYVIRRATSLDWTVLDAFYRLCGMKHFKAMLDAAEQGVNADEGPICNLATISQYLRRFMDEYKTVITADVLVDHLLSRMLFGSFLYALWRLGESEFEDKENPFPRGRIPFLTIHQAKGLEFPVVVLANPSKANRGPQLTEIMVRPFLQRDEGEPLDRMTEFDIMRMFYVALSRAQNLLVIADLKGAGTSINAPFRALMDDLPTIEDLDINSIPVAGLKQDDIPKPYSYTGDYIAYKRCPREYMFFRKYEFEGSRTQTAFFGSLVHRTLDDLHNHLIELRKEGVV